MQIHPAPDEPPAESVRVEPRAPAATRRSSLDDEFSAFMTAAGPDMLRTAWLLVGDAHRAEELTQQAFVRTFAAWSRVRDGNPTAYTRRTLLNLRTDTWRRRRREVLTPPDDLPEHAAPLDGRSDDRDQVVRALAALTERQRRVVVLRHLVGLTEQEVADDLGVSTGTVKSTASRALARLRTTLAPDGREDPTAPTTPRSTR